MKNTELVAAKRSRFCAGYRIIFMLTIFFLAGKEPLFAQPGTKKVPTTHNYQEDYMQLSIKQKRTASGMLAGGVVLIVAPALILLNSELGDDNLARKTVIVFSVMGLGGLSVLGSIPLFIAAARNKDRALAASAGFKLDSRQVLSGSSMVQKPLPSLVLKLRLGKK